MQLSVHPSLAQAAVTAKAVQAVWAKGYTELLDLMEQHRKSDAPRMYVDCYGAGEDLNEAGPLHLHDRPALTLGLANSKP